MTLIDARPRRRDSFPTAAGRPASNRLRVLSDLPADDLAPLLDALRARVGVVRVVSPERWLADDREVTLLWLRGPQALRAVAPLELDERVLNRPSAVRAARNALLTSQSLSRAGVAGVRAIGCRDPRSAVEVATALGMPVVVRSTTDDDASATRCCSADAVRDEVEYRLTCTPAHRAVMVQEHVEDATAVHVLVSCGHVAGAALAPLGGTWTAVDVEPAIRTVAVRAVTALDGDVMAVHVLIRPDGTLGVLRVDPAPPVARFDHATWGRAAAAASARLDLAARRQRVLRSA